MYTKSNYFPESIVRIVPAEKTLILLCQNPRIWQIPSFLDAKELAYFKTLCNDNEFEPSFVQAENGDREVNDGDVAVGHKTFRSLRPPLSGKTRLTQRFSRTRTFKVCKISST